MSPSPFEPLFEYPLSAIEERRKSLDALIAERDALQAQVAALRDGLRATMAHLADAAVTVRRSEPDYASTLDDFIQGSTPLDDDRMEELAETFEARVRAEERERCAKVADEFIDRGEDLDCIADAIRALKD